MKTSNPMNSDQNHIPKRSERMKTNNESTIEEILWDDEESVNGRLTVPDWIDQDITAQDIMAIMQGGCASGAYMPACSYWQAMQTMNEHGDDVLQYIDDADCNRFVADLNELSWGGMACHILSIAIEIWASHAHTELWSQIEEKQGESK